MAITDSPLVKSGLPPISDDAVQAVENLVDRAYYWLLLEEDRDVIERNCEFLISALRLRMGQVMVWSREELEEASR